MTAYCEVVTAAVLTAQSLLHLIARETKLDSFYDKGGRPPMLENSITFSNVSFSYPKRNKQALTGNYLHLFNLETYILFTEVNFSISKGQTVAIIGLNGSGKSTIVKLLQRLYDPKTGVIEIGGINIKCLNLSWFRYV